VRPATIAGVCACVAAIVIALSAGTPLDYGSSACALNPACDDASQPIDALAEGHVGEFFRRQQLIGPVSEVLSAPFVAVAGDDRLDRYRAALLPCLLAVALLGAYLARIAAKRGRPWWFQFLIALGAVINPVTFWVIRFGQPVEFVGAVLVAVAGLAACRGRVTTAGLVAGVAVATKLWALVALPLLAFALPAGWRRFLATAVVSGGLLIAIPALAAPHVFHENVTALGRLGSVPGTVSKISLWYPATDPVEFDSPLRVAPGGVIETQHIAGLELPRRLAQLAHGLILLAGLGIGIAWVLRSRPGNGPAILLAIALALLLRCVLDPGVRSYYHEPFLLAVLSYETLVRRWLPGLAIAGAAGVEGISIAAKHVDSGGVLSALYLAWTLPLAAAMAIELIRLPSDRRGAWRQQTAAVGAGSAGG
jgi:Glycosyltransferase family 87